MIKNDRQNYHYDYAALNLFLDERLQKWAAWRTKILENGLGYPSSSIESKLKGSPGFLSKSYASAGLNIDDDSEKIDALINELFLIKKDCAQAIKSKYLQSTKNQNNTTFKNNLKLAKMWLIARLH